MSVGDAGQGTRRPGRRPALVLAVLLGTTLLALLLWPNGLVLNRAVVRLYVFFLDHGMPPQVTPDAYAVLLNLLAFVPLGWAGVVLFRWRPLPVALGLAAFSATVELVQALPAISRDPSVVDVICNALGGVLGVAAGSFVRRHPHGSDGATGDQTGVDQAVDEAGDVRRDHLDG